MKLMKSGVFVALLGLALGLVSWQTVSAHCQVPCGIYGDETRFVLLREHITTIEKGMNQINELSADPGRNANQLARWVMNKEDHVAQFNEIVVAYFLQQRIKPSPEGSGTKDDALTAKLVLCHEMLVATMKCKQTTDTAHTKKLSALVDKFEAAYFGKAARAHLEEHHREEAKTG